jgi:hypothetical protein
MVPTSRVEQMKVQNLLVLNFEWKFTKEQNCNDISLNQYSSSGIYLIYPFMSSKLGKKSTPSIPEEQLGIILYLNFPKTNTPEANL